MLAATIRLRVLAIALPPHLGTFPVPLCRAITALFCLLDGQLPLLFGLHGDGAHGPLILIEPRVDDLSGVWVRHVLVLEALLPPILLVLVPALQALLKELVRGVDGMVEPGRVVIQAGILRSQQRQRALDQHTARLLVFRIVLVGWLVLGSLASGQHIEDPIVHELLVLLRVVDEVFAPHALHIAPDAGGEGAKIRGVHAQGVNKDDTPEVSIGPGANELLRLVQAVAVEIRKEAKGLDDDSDILELPAALEVQGVACAALEEVLDVLATPPSHGQEGDVADAEAAVAHDGALGAVLGAVH
mmetsp:Transcript_11759/g.32187  ORF Transcript_11759/g.32187 Transcript_11759/m.32187 type:complete len:301 (-) Transcript_11759:695-1597(-)